MPRDPRDAAISDAVRLRHMLDAARAVASFIQGKAENDLRGDLLLLFGVVKAIEIVGEAARCVSDETRAMLPELPWEQIVGMRHRVIHVYFDIEPRIVWDTATIDLPPLVAVLERYLKGRGG